MHSDSLKHHIIHMEDSHTKLEKELAILENNHQNDSVEAQEIKKKKLHIKDEILRCRQQLTEMLQ